ncbi:MAG: hypothetical protein LRS43_00115, partial [Desulfurococcales archaeon]|nr:hypothetical protein [Desulfurococcales archaeon]
TGNFTHTNALNTEYIGGGSLDVQGLYIAIGSGNKPFEPGDFNLNNTLQSKGELSLSFGRSFNQTHYIASVSASFGSTTQTLNVNEIGLLLKRTVQHYYLIARDVLPSTISLAPGDQLIVTYRFVFEEPVVYNFAELISRYILAWGTYNNGSTGNFKDKTGATWPGIDLYTDSTGGDTIKEVVYAELYQANGTPSFDMTWYGPQPGDTLLWSGSPTIGFSINSTTACIDVIVNVGVPPGTTGDYLAVFLKTDANVTSGALEKDFALFYTVFNPPLQGGNQYTIDLRICFG